MMNALKSFHTVYVAKPEFINELQHELSPDCEIIENLIFSPTVEKNICFALDVWRNPQFIEFASISDAAKQLRGLGKYWFLNPVSHIRRSRLIEAALAKLPPLVMDFPQREPLPPIGCFSLLNNNSLVAATHRWKNPPLGHFQFNEDKKNPPNRAYLKLWEALSLLGKYPGPEDSVIDLGASPGGWTFVMQRLGAKVTAFDKSPLASNVASLPNVTFRRESAFALNPHQLDQKVDWVLSDVACYPERLYNLTQKWIASEKAKQLIFTIKLQGATDWETLKKFIAIPNSRVLHLYHNKHEATFFYPATPALFP